MVDVTRSDTFKSAKLWLNDLKNKVDATIPIVLLANKCDLSCKLDNQFLDAFCHEFEINGWFAVSAKTRQNVDESINFLIAEIIKYKNSITKHNDVTHKLADKSVVSKNILKNSTTQKRKRAYLTQIDAYMCDISSSSDTIDLNDDTSNDSQSDGRSKCC